MDRYDNVELRAREAYTFALPTRQGESDRVDAGSMLTFLTIGFEIKSKEYYQEGVVSVHKSLIWCSECLHDTDK